MHRHGGNGQGLADVSLTTRGGHGEWRRKLRAQGPKSAEERTRSRGRERTSPWERLRRGEAR